MKICMGFDGDVVFVGILWVALECHHGKPFALSCQGRVLIFLRSAKKFKWLGLEHV